MSVPENPDFAQLFDPAAPCNAGRSPILTPHTASALREAADDLFTWAHQDITDHGDEAYDPAEDTYWYLFDRYPPITWNQGATWRTYAAHAIADLAEVLGRGERPMPITAAEEMALWLMVDQAQNQTEFRLENDDLRVNLPRHPDDFSWDDCRDFLFHDHDVLLLFDEAPSGVEDPNDPMHQMAPDTADYRPAHWFNPFWSAQPRHPERDAYLPVATRGPLNRSSGPQIPPRPEPRT